MTTLPTAEDLRRSAQEAAGRCGVDLNTWAGDRPVTSPINGEPLFSVREQDAADVARAVERAEEAFRHWRTVPAPVRGGLVAASASCSGSTRRTSARWSAWRSARSARRRWARSRR